MEAEIRKQPPKRQPGAGAVEFARTFIEGLTERESKPIINRLLIGEFTADNRVKRCAYCDFFWKDGSLRNTRRTCCADCKIAAKTLQKRAQRASYVLLHPDLQQPKKRKLADDYINWVEYPFWLEENSMVSVGWKYEVPHSNDVLDARSVVF